MATDGPAGQCPKVDKQPSLSAKPKKRKRRVPRDANAPVPPANCFTRFMMIRRPVIVQEHPELSHIEVTKRIAEEWRALSADDKEVYMKTASDERKEYMKELSAYKKTDAYKQFRKKMKRQVESSFFDQEPNDDRFDTPIFSKEFLDLNRQRESELRRLRMEVVRLEEEQVALDSNIERLKMASERLEAEMAQEKGLSDKVRSHLDAFRRLLVQAFAHMPFPGTNIVPTVTTIDAYMNNIHKLVLEAPGEHQDFVAKVRDIVTKLKLPSTSL